MLQFKRDGDGTWTFGQKRTVVEDGSRWAVNPRRSSGATSASATATRWSASASFPSASRCPIPRSCPTRAFQWSQQWAVNLKCLDGADAGVEVVYKPTTVGGIQAVAGLIEAVRDRLNGGQHDGKVAPIVQLEKDTYPHGQHGKVWMPVLTIVDWMPLSGPAPAPDAGAATAAATAAEQPRRRRVA